MITIPAFGEEGADEEELRANAIPVAIPAIENASKRRVRTRMRRGRKVFTYFVIAAQEGLPSEFEAIHRDFPALGYLA